MNIEEIIDNLELYTVGRPKKDRVFITVEELQNLIDEIKSLEQTDVLDKIRAEIKEWYWQMDKQALAKDPCVVDAMIDLFIRTINKYKAERKDKGSEE